ncbi:bifunctional DNA primase/polymerase famiily protein [Saccharomonospora cyanea NA-134]|uniref:Bifunctional DNA primase/polymerase famiily protein n=1 Tax=Saccharomonospora cyanea NA-134 TaxID=882082 RepID=H5XG58_9PSEU|nr:bifunctional DNA primase/polymerase famiily protein [Saccharomonospora cyanea NA-134]
MIATTCQRQGCETELPRARRGRPARYCSAACRTAAYRARPRVPRELTQRARWVRRAADKRPVQTNGRNASSTQPRTWTTYDQAADSSEGVGLGFVLNGDGTVCLDLDGCLADGRVTEWARRILDRCPSTFVEVSPSGTGLHVWGYGSVPRGRVIREQDGTAVEVYGSGRYIAVTGRRWRGAPTRLADLSAVIEYL